MARRDGGSWNQPIVVGLITATVGVGGAIAAAVITSSGGGSASAPMRSAVAEPEAPTIKSFGYVPQHGGVRLIVSGSATGLPTGYTIYAIAKPETGQHRWFASNHTEPNKHGLWTASIVIVPPTKVSVQAVTMGGTLPFTEGHPRGDPDRESLEQHGPQAATGLVSRPKTATPPP